MKNLYTLYKKIIKAGNELWSQIDQKLIILILFPPASKQQKVIIIIIKFPVENLYKLF